MYRWVVEASTHKVREANSNKGCEAESNAIGNILYSIISLEQHVSRAENNVYTYLS